MNTNTVYPGLSIKLRGVDFPVNPIVLESEGIDMILGMRWLAKFKGTIQCAEKTVSLTTPSGNRIEVKVSMSLDSEGTVYHLSLGAAEDIKVVNEFLDVFSVDQCSSLLYVFDEQSIYIWISSLWFILMTF